MALITCKECGSQISEFAEICPSCGAPTAMSKDYNTTQEEKNRKLLISRQQALIRRPLNQE